VNLITSGQQYFPSPSQFFILDIQRGGLHFERAPLSHLLANRVNTRR